MLGGLFFRGGVALDTSAGHVIAVALVSLLSCFIGARKRKRRAVSRNYCRCFCCWKQRLERSEREPCVLRECLLPHPPFGAESSWRPRSSSHSCVVRILVIFTTVCELQVSIFLSTSLNRFWFACLFIYIYSISFIAASAF